MSSLLDQYSDLLLKIDTVLPKLNDLTISIAKVAAPPFNEHKRGVFVMEKFQELGYHAFMDKVGNVLAFKSQLDDTELVLSAHLDTVFEETEIAIRVDGDRIYGMGVGDDSRGLAQLLILAELLYETNSVEKILFVATVGEEGRGDLRGVKHLFHDEEHTKLNPKVFITIDGNRTERIINQSIGSRRYRVHFKGPGGHSFGAFGTVNPAYALADFMTQFSQIELKPNVKTTYSVGVIGGGRSINAIPEHVWVDIDLRSEEKNELDRLDGLVKEFARNACARENNQRIGNIIFELDKVGDRPAGKLNAEWLEDIIEKIHAQLGIDVEYAGSSTDANVPQSLGIPAIAVASVQESGNAHTSSEWIDASEKSLLPLKRNLLLVLSLV